MNERKLLRRIARGETANVSFDDLRHLTEALASSCAASAAATTSSSTRESIS